VSFKMDDEYVDVAQRLRDFRAAYPEGSMQQVSVDFREFGGTSWVIYTAAAYRTPGDVRPGHGTAWEPVPGKTPFTRDSELQNAETAAWGRAILAALAGDTKRIASRQEVENRQADRETLAAKEAVKQAWLANHTEWDPEAMKNHYQQQVGQSPDAATAADLQNYARSLLT
jgi:hypothetical protein